jgi:hypothetical protein
LAHRDAEHRDRVRADAGRLDREHAMSAGPRRTAKRASAPRKAKNRNKTTATAVDPIRFIDKVESEVKRRDSHELVAMMQEIVGEPPKMWGPTIVGFGAVHYRYESGREGDICLTGFSPRSGSLVVYLGSVIHDEKLMKNLGKHKTGEGCLYINKLDDVDRSVLKELIKAGVAATRKQREA